MKNTPCKDRREGLFPRELQMERLRRLIQEELTDLQRYTLTAFYFERKTIAQIARDRSVNRSTVFRTLRRTEEKLRKFLRY